MTDLMAISKGFGDQLKLSRLRLEKIDGLDPALISPEEIDCVLAIVGGRYAAELMLHGKYEKAIPQWERYLKRFPKDHNAQAEVGRAHWWLNQLDVAKKYLERAHQLDPEHAPYVQELEKVARTDGANGVTILRMEHRSLKDGGDACQTRRTTFTT